MDELVQTLVLDGVPYDVYAVYAEGGEEIDYYDAYDADGSCINLGAPFWAAPDEAALREFLEQTC